MKGNQPSIANRAVGYTFRDFAFVTSLLVTLAAQFSSALVVHSTSLTRRTLFDIGFSTTSTILFPALVWAEETQSEQYQIGLLSATEAAELLKPVPTYQQEYPLLSAECPWKPLLVRRRHSSKWHDDGHVTFGTLDDLLRSIHLGKQMEGIGGLFKGVGHTLGSNTSLMGFAYRLSLTWK